MNDRCFRYLHMSLIESKFFHTCVCIYMYLYIEVKQSYAHCWTSHFTLCMKSEFFDTLYSDNRTRYDSSRRSSTNGYVWILWKSSHEICSWVNLISLYWLEALELFFLWTDLSSYEQKFILKGFYFRLVYSPCRRPMRWSKLAYLFIYFRSSIRGNQGSW